MTSPLTNLERLTRLPQYRRALPVAERLVPLTAEGRELRLQDMQGRSPVEIERLKIMVDLLRGMPATGSATSLELIGHLLTLAADNPFLRGTATLPFQIVMVSSQGLNRVVIDRDLRAQLNLPADFSQDTKDTLQVIKYDHKACLSNSTWHLISLLSKFSPGLKLPSFEEAKIFVAFRDHLEDLQKREGQIIAFLEEGIYSETEAAEETANAKEEMTLWRREIGLIQRYLRKNPVRDIVLERGSSFVFERGLRCDPALTTYAGKSFADSTHGIISPSEALLFLVKPII